MAASSIGYLIHINFNPPIVLPSRTKSTSLSFTFSNATHPFKWNHRICALPPAVSVMASGSSREVLPPALDSSSEPPAIFDGTPKLYISYSCPYAQRTWIARNCKGLQEKIMLVPIDLKNRPDWYKEKVYPANKVPSLEYKNEVKGESMDLIRYIDSNFEGPSLFPDDPSKRESAEELFSYFDSFYKAVISSLKEDRINDATFDSIETALSKFVDGSFFLGMFSLVDIAYAPFIERFQPFLLEVKNYDITKGRTKLAAWIKVLEQLVAPYRSRAGDGGRSPATRRQILEMNQIEAYTVTKRDPKEHLENYKRRFLSQL